MKVLMLAAENGALPQGKVGGMGDVIRDLPRALVALGHEVTVLTPAYGMFAGLPGARRSGSVAVPFAGATEHVDRYTLPGDLDGLSFEVLEHPRFAPQGPGHIYCDDGAGAPFHTDATKFAFFSAAGAAVALESRPDIVHLHDWHVGTFLALRRLDSRFAALRSIRTVFTIHNLAMQGTRPLAETDSSWFAWFPWIRSDLDSIADPGHKDCVNPMAAGIRLADIVTTVSPTYAREILEPDDPAAGRHGGEGLESDLGSASSEGRLIGILNGCSYSVARRRPSWKSFVELAESNIRRWIASGPAVTSAHFLALERLAMLPKRRPRLLLTSIGRITGQKVSLFREHVAAGHSALDAILESSGADEWLVVLGSGDPRFEQFFCEAMVRRPNILFLRGYSDPLADALFKLGDLFLMPSSFEPCGISQMLAMRAGQPCVAHAVGGLRDTISDRTGFLFDGAAPSEQAENFVASVAAAVELRRARSPGWDAMQAAAAAERFDWGVAARRYVEEAYLGIDG